MYSSFYTACFFKQSLGLCKYSSLKKDTVFNPLLLSVVVQALWSFFKMLCDNCAMCHLTTSAYLSLCSRSVLSTVRNSHTFLYCLPLTCQGSLFTAALLLPVTGRNITRGKKILISLQGSTEIFISCWFVRQFSLPKAPLQQCRPSERDLYVLL